ncbi:hypothetical protein A0H81_06183 [Grifola frondosa]|uniref:Uncharacterized protein n=1 Tax=Grifola frondosa TaxID=5627 RepID=A0A1C7MBC4_GRIFR|nr:hypothetical protein A0H81_06183 [Grifola frondosa]
MPILLDEDLFNLVCEHIHDLATLSLTARAIAISKTHPLRNALVRRILRRSIRLSSSEKTLELSKALINYLLLTSQSASIRAENLREISVSLGPSKNGIEEFWYQEIKDDYSHDLARAQALAEMLPHFLSLTTNIRKLTWIRAPLPDSGTLNILASLPRLQSFSIDCATGEWSGRNMDDKDEYWKFISIIPFFSTLGPNLTTLDLRNINEDVFKSIASGFSSLTKLRHLRLDLTCGCWDWDGRGSPQQGPSENYVFPRIAKNIETLELIVNDAAVRLPREGPFNLVDPSSLKRLDVNVNHCYGWTSITNICMFSALNPTSFTSLVHFSLDDEVWDRKRWNRGSLGSNDWNERGRTYIGLHDFLSGLPQLRELWVTEKCLVVPIAADNSTWGEAERYSNTTDEDMERTVGAPEWALMTQIFPKLESLRVGFGMLTPRWLRVFLNLCDPTKLRQIGFDFDWKAIDVCEPLPQDVVATLALFPSLTDIHILHPRPEMKEHMYDGNTVRDVQCIFKSCPNVFRVGIGKNIVWERRTPWPADEDDVPIQLLGHIGRNGESSEEVSIFYNAGSAMGDQDESVANEDHVIMVENGELLHIFESLPVKMSQTAKSSAKSTSSPISTTPSVLDYLKLTPSEAATRLRTNALGLLALVVLTNLLPLPSLWSSFNVVRERRYANSLYYYLCTLELFALAIMSLNVLQASYALKYPRTLHPHPTPLAKPTQMSPPARQWRLNGLSPKSSPQLQKSFSYAPSPVSTPSRMLNYTISSPGTPLDDSFTSSITSLPPSPSSPLAAYRGRHNPTLGRAFNGALLSRLARDDSDEE